MKIYTTKVRMTPKIPTEKTLSAHVSWSGTSMDDQEYPKKEKLIPFIQSIPSSGSDTEMLINNDNQSQEKSVEKSKSLADYHKKYYHPYYDQYYANKK